MNYQADKLQKKILLQPIHLELSGLYLSLSTERNNKLCYNSLCYNNTFAVWIV